MYASAQGTCLGGSKWMETWVEGSLGQAFQVWWHQVWVQCRCIAQRALLGMHLLVEMLLHATAPSPSTPRINMCSALSPSSKTQGSKAWALRRHPDHSITRDTQH